MRAGFLRPGDQLVLQLARQPLRLPAGQFQRRVLSPVPVPEPGVIVTAQGARVVLELDQVQPALAENQQVDLMPFAVPVAEFEVGPGTERVTWREQRPDQVQAFGLVRELGALPRSSAEVPAPPCLLSPFPGAPR